MDIIYKDNHYDKTDYNEFVKRHIDNPCNIKTMLIMRRTPELIFAMCMCLERNNTVIPIDPAYPKKHIDYIIKDSAPDKIICFKKNGRISPKMMWHISFIHPAQPVIQKA